MLDPDATGRDRIDLAEALRALRRASGLSGERLAVKAHMSQGKISRIETGKVIPSLVDVERIVQALDVPAGEARELIVLAQIANTEFRNKRQNRQRGVANRQRELAALEVKCGVMRHVLPAMLTGLLQTPEYIAANVASMPAGIPEGQRDDLILRKVKRQELLYREDKRFSFLLMEAAVRCRVVPPPAMAVQVDHLVSLGMMPNIDIAVIPLDRIIPSPPLNVFVVYDEWLVTLETKAGMVILRDPQDVRHHLELFEFYRELSLKGVECREFLRGIAEQFRRVGS
jgi:transcriptional regulator with XRE-family HTH domain